MYKFETILNKALYLWWLLLGFIVFNPGDTFFFVTVRKLTIVCEYFRQQLTFFLDFQTHWWSRFTIWRSRKPPVDRMHFLWHQNPKSTPHLLPYQTSHRREPLGKRHSVQDSYRRWLEFDWHKCSKIGWLYGHGTSSWHSTDGSDP
jgi:hypothetical protein